jgi:hypothetical protein
LLQISASGATKETGHLLKECPKWMKHMLKKGEDIITFVDETLYLRYSKFIWWIDSGATIHVANSMQGMHSIGRHAPCRV